MEEVTVPCVVCGEPITTKDDGFTVVWHNEPCGDYVKAHPELLFQKDERNEWQEPPVN
jgi:hypothetical protein